jgi:Fe-S-cluster-containing dehydrogenase component
MMVDSRSRTRFARELAKGNVDDHQALCIGIRHIDYACVYRMRFVLGL